MTIGNNFYKTTTSPQKHYNYCPTCGQIKYKIKKKGVKKKMNDLNKTIELMESKDYKERFKAEYYQTKIRYTKLHNMLVKYEAGKLDFTPTCSIDLLKEQAKHMGQYLYCLEIRAAIEDITL